VCSLALAFKDAFGRALRVWG